MNFCVIKISYGGWWPHSYEITFGIIIELEIWHFLAQNIFNMSNKVSSTKKSFKNYFFVQLKSVHPTILKNICRNEVFPFFLLSLAHVQQKLLCLSAVNTFFFHSYAHRHTSTCVREYLRNERARETEINVRRLLNISFSLTFNFSEFGSCLKQVFCDF